MTRNPRGAKMPPCKILKKLPNTARRPCLPSMYPDFPVDRLKEIISQMHPAGVIFTAIEPVPSPHLSRLFKIILSNSTTLLLSIPPIFGIRLLRQERKIMIAQVALLIYLNNPQLLTNNTIPPTSSSPQTDLNGLPTLSNLLPNLLKYSLSEKDLSTPYILTTPTPGTPLTTLSPYLTIPESKSIHHQLATLSHTLSQITSPGPNRTFGLAADVLSSSPSSPPPTSWSQSFTSLLESSMRDAEDMLVNLPYHEIRRYLHEYSEFFDMVTESRLVIMNLWDPDNVMVTREEFPGSRQGIEGQGARIVGLRDWSQGIFGDVCLGLAIPPNTGSDGVSVNNGNSKRSQENIDITYLEKEEEEERSETETETAKKFRTLMYTCYRAVVAISTEYQRPRPDSMKRDDAERMKLTSALKELSALDLLA